jgi:hypothetical protein
MAVEAYPPPQFVGQPVLAPWTGRPAQPFAAASSRAPALQPPLPPPRFRAQSPDEPTTAALLRPALLNMPSPEQLGVATARPAGDIDWDATHRRLDRLGALCFHREKLDRGGYRFTCLLPTSQADRTHRVEVVAATEAEAVRLALEKAEEWAGGR